MTPNLVLGGAEYWILGLLKYCDRDRISWSGIAVVNADDWDEEMCRQAALHAPIYGGPPAPGRKTIRPSPAYVPRFATNRGALAALCAHSDVLIVWGVAKLGELLNGLNFAGQVILVSHGAGKWTEDVLQTSREAAHRLVAVSRWAATAFRVPGAAVVHRGGDERPPVSATECQSYDTPVSATECQSYDTPVSATECQSYFTECQSDKGVTVIHNGGDQERCRVTRAREVVRREWGARPGERLIGYVGRFSFEKNPLAAAVTARRLGRPFRAVYIGSRWMEPDLKACILKVVPNSVLIPPQTDIGNALNALDVLVLASPSEGFSLALTEAWLCGVPTVATRVGAVPELEAMHGQLVTPVPVNATPDELAQAVLRALGEENRAVVDRACRVASTHYTAQAMADRWTSFLHGTT